MTVIALHRAFGADALSHGEGTTHHLRRNPAPTFQSEDAHVLRRVLDCGDSCVYVGLERTPGEKELESITSPVGPNVSVRKLSRKMHCPTTWLRLLSSCPANDWPPPRTVPDALRDAYTMGGRAAVSDFYFSQRYSGGDAMAPHWSSADLDARIAASKLEEAMQGIYSYGMDEARYVDHAIARHAKLPARG